jgi:hypothetical protein
MTRIDKFVCPNCGGSHSSFDNAMKEHCACVSWSCRNMHDFHSLYPIEPSKNACCRLCDFSFSHNSAPNFEVRLKLHANSHKLRDCAQVIFTTEAQFIEHLIDEHAARRSSVDPNHELLDWLQKARRRPDNYELSALVRKLEPFRVPTSLEPWESLQYVERLDGVALVRSARLVEKSHRCESRQPNHIVTIVDVHFV